MRRVHIRYDVLEKNGNDYLTYGEELQKIIDNINKIKEDLNQNWESPNKVTYVEKVTNYVDVVQSNNELFLK